MTKGKNQAVYHKEESVPASMTVVVAMSVYFSIIYPKESWLTKYTEITFDIKVESSILLTPPSSQWSLDEHIVRSNLPRKC